MKELMQRDLCSHAILPLVGNHWFNFNPIYQNFPVLIGLYALSRWPLRSQHLLSRSGEAGGRGWNEVVFSNSQENFLVFFMCCCIGCSLVIETKFVLSFPLWESPMLLLSLKLHLIAAFPSLWTAIFVNNHLSSGILYSQPAPYSLFLVLDFPFFSSACSPIETFTMWLLGFTPLPNSCCLQYFLPPRFAMLSPHFFWTLYWLVVALHYPLVVIHATTKAGNPLLPYT